MVHLDTTVVVLLHKYFSSWLSTFLSLTLWHISPIRSPFSSRLITCNFSSVPIVFRRFFTWIALGDADLRFPLILVRKVNGVEEETKWSVWLYHQRNQSIHVTEGVTVTSLPASLLQKISQIALNQKFEKWCKFSSPVKAKSPKTKLRKMRTTCIWISTKFFSTAFCCHPLSVLNRPVLSQHSLEELRKTERNLSSWSLYQPRFEPSTSQTCLKHLLLNHLAWCYVHIDFILHNFK